VVCGVGVGECGLVVVCWGGVGGGSLNLHHCGLNDYTKGFSFSRFLLQSAPQQKQDECCSTTEGISHPFSNLETKESEKQSADCCEKKKKKHKEKGDMPVEQNQDGALEWSGDAGTKNHCSDIDPCLNTPEHKKKKKHRKGDQQDSSQSRVLVSTQSDSCAKDVSGASVSLPIIKKRKRKHKRKEMEEGDVDTMEEGFKQQASETRTKQIVCAEVHKLPRVNGVDEKEQEIALLAVEEHSSRKRKHKAMKVTGRDSPPLRIVPDSYNKESDDGGDPMQSTAKRLKGDNSSLGSGKAKKSKHKHSRKL